MKEINPTRYVTLVSYRWERCFISDSRKWKLDRSKLVEPTKSLNEKNNHFDDKKESEIQFFYLCLSQGSF